MVIEWEHLLIEKEKNLKFGFNLIRVEHNKFVEYTK